MSLLLSSGPTFIFEEFATEHEKKFRTLAGATSYGSRRLKAYGYLAANRKDGGKHIVAEWKDRGVVRAIVWR
jgi:hypothetical protein